MIHETFEDLQKLNPDVIGWITIYDTNIDYPLLYSAESNNMYLGHNAKGEPQSSGSIFIDYRNKPDFTDFNTIIHGHHMDQHKMFGDIEKFRDQKFFEKHEYGNLYYNNKNYGIDLLVFLETDGYNGKIYAPAIDGEDAKLQYINYCYKKATYIRGVEDVKSFVANETRTSPITPDDHIAGSQHLCNGQNQRAHASGCQVARPSCGKPVPEIGTQKERLWHSRSVQLSRTRWQVPCLGMDPAPRHTHPSDFYSIYSFKKNFQTQRREGSW